MSTLSAISFFCNAFAFAHLLLLLVNSTHNYDGNYGNPKFWIRDLKSPKRGKIILTFCKECRMLYPPNIA